MNKTLQSRKQHLTWWLLLALVFLSIGIWSISIAVSNSDEKCPKNQTFLRKLDVPGFWGPQFITNPKGFYMFWRPQGTDHRLTVIHVQRKGNQEIHVTYKGVTIDGVPLPHFQVIIDALKMSSSHDCVMSLPETARLHSRTWTAWLTFLISAIMLIWIFYLLMRSPPAKKDIQEVPSNWLVDLPFYLYLLLFHLPFHIYLVVKHPFEIHELWYLEVIEYGRTNILELVHPFYVTIMDVFQWILGIFGYNGPFLIPFFVLNVIAGTLTLLLLYHWSRKYAGAIESSVSVIFFSALLIVWKAQVRPVPYAWGLLSLGLMWFVLAEWSRRPGKYLMAGVLAACSSGFHMAGVVLVFAGLAYIFLERYQTDRGRTWINFLTFLVGYTLTLTIMYLILQISRGLSLWSSLLYSPGLWATLKFLEQVPNTAFFDNTLSSRISWLISRLWDTQTAFGVGLLFVAAIMYPLTRRGKKAWTNILFIAFINLLAYLVFFLLFNTNNGFICASILVVPVVWAVFMNRFRFKWLIYPVLITQIGFALFSLQSKPLLTDDFFTSMHALNQELAPDGLLIVPGCVLFEPKYLGNFHIIGVTLNKNEPDCDDIPMTDGEQLLQLVQQYLTQNKKVLYLAVSDQANTEHFFYIPEGCDPARRTGCALKKEWISGLNTLLSNHFKTVLIFKFPHRDTFYRVLPMQKKI